MFECLKVNAMPPPPPAGKCYVMPFPVKVIRPCCPLPPSALSAVSMVGALRRRRAVLASTADPVPPRPVRTPAHVRRGPDAGQPAARQSRYAAACMHLPLCVAICVRRKLAVQETCEIWPGSLVCARCLTSWHSHFSLCSPEEGCGGAQDVPAERQLLLGACRTLGQAHGQIEEGADFCKVTGRRGCLYCLH
jgi:hypothetical protein